jgi:hypothetical protein
LLIERNSAAVRIGTEEQCREAATILGKINLKSEAKGGCTVTLDSTVSVKQILV